MGKYVITSSLAVSAPSFIARPMLKPDFFNTLSQKETFNNGKARCGSS